MSASNDGARRPGPTARTRVVEVRGDSTQSHEDRLATEEPLEIRLTWPGAPAQRLAVTMRTPGHDFELAAGWLVHEQMLRPEDVIAIRYCVDADLEPAEEFNVVTVQSAVPPAYLPAARAVTSACGVCGTTSITDALRAVPAVPDVGAVPRHVVGELVERLATGQPGFARTGGLHAAGLFGLDGAPVVIREDVGRHNAVDKVVGSRILAGEAVPPVLVLSGRVGFELVQKAVVAGVSVIVAVGAPTTLAVGLAERSGLGLAGFARNDRHVIYAGPSRFGV